MFMSKKLTGELKGLAVDGLQARLVELRGELAKERSLVASGTRPENPGKIRQLRRNVARVLTVLNERQRTEVKK
jgi:large subunit ribosomal protein L29